MPTGGLAEWLVPLLWNTAASFAMNIVTNKLTKKKASTSPTYSMGALQTQCNSNMVIPIIYGRVKCAGNSLWQDGSGKTINRLVGFGLGHNYGVSDVRLDDVDINTLTGCNYTAYMGDGVQAIDSRVTGADETARAKLVGGMKYDAYLALSITASDKISSNPNLTAVWQGRIVKVYTTPTTYTEAWSNNVWCILDFMTSPDGCNIPIENIDVQSFIDAAAYAQPGDGTRDWQLNLILDEKKSRQDWLNEMLLCFRSYRTYQNGKHGLLIDKSEPVSQIFTVKPTESIQIDWQTLSEDIERIILKYPDPDYEWQNVGAPATMNPPFKNATYDINGTVVSNGVPLAKTIEIHGVTNFKQASQLSWFYLNQAQTCGEYVTYTCNKRALNRTIGDVIGIYDPITKRTEPGLAYKRYRIMAMTEPQGMSIQLYCREYNESLYNDTMGSIAPVLNVSKLPDNKTAPPAVTDLTATEYSWLSQNSIYINNIDVAFTASDYFDVVSYLISISSNNGISWRYLNTISATTYRIENVAAGNYIVGVQPVNKAGVAGAKSTVNITVVDANLPAPDDLQAFSVTYLNGKYIFSWTKPSSSSEIQGYEIRKGSTWDSGQVVKRAVGSDTNYTEVTALLGTVKFFCKPYNSGGYSANALSDLITIDVLPMVQTLYSQSAFEQLCAITGYGEITTDYTCQSTDTTYEILSTKTYAELCAMNILGIPQGTATLLGPVVTLDTLVQASVSISESWVCPPDNSNVYEISTSLDGVNFSDFKLLGSGSLPMKAFQLRITLSGTSVPAILEHIGVDVIASQNTISYSNITIPVGGLELAFSQTFATPPAVIISPNVDALTAKKDTPTVTSCKLYLLNSTGVDTGGTADITVVGI